MPLLLRTFGSLSLVGSPAADTFSETRRKPLGLLALLAGATDRGLSREKLGAYLWPEGDSEKVRGVLKQTLYSIRQELEPELIQGTVDLRLNPAVIDCDTWQLDRLAAAGDLAAAAERYHGPFLDGIHLPDAPGFEHWVDDQRDRYARKFAGLVEKLARGAMGRNEPREAMEWWRRLTEFDPLDVRAVSGLLHACLQAGDRPRAIRYAERHMTLLRKELEITPDPEIRRLVEQARARPGST